MAACGDVAVVLKAAGSREQSVYIPQTSQPFLKFPLLFSCLLLSFDRSPSFLFNFPLLSLLARVNLQHVFFNGKARGK